MERITEDIFSAAVNPDRWPSTLEKLATLAGVAGAALRFWNARSKRVDVVLMSDSYPPEALRDYVQHFGELDPYAPKLSRHPVGEWLALSECFGPELLMRDEWYCDYVLRNGWKDISAIPLFECPAGKLLFSLNFAGTTEPDHLGSVERVRPLLQSITDAARVSIIGRHAKPSGIGGLVAGELGAAVIISDEVGRVVQMNGTAEALVLRGDPVSMKAGRLVARRAFENARLYELLVGTAKLNEQHSRKMLLGSTTHRELFFLSVLPLAAKYSPTLRPAALILITGTAQVGMSATELAELFGFTRAEAKLALQLVQGETLSEIAGKSGVSVATVRSQLASILKKAGVRRQIDLIRVLTRVPSRARSS